MGLQTTILQNRKEREGSLQSEDKELAAQIVQIERQHQQAVDEKVQLEQQITKLKAAAKEDGDDALYAESVKAAYEEQIKDLNREVLLLQTAVLQYRKEKSEWEKERVKLKPQGRMNAKMKMLEQEVEALRAAATDDGVSASYADVMKAAYEEQIKEMNEEMMMLQTTLLQQKQDTKGNPQGAQGPLSFPPGVAQDLHKQALQLHDQAVRKLTECRLMSNEKVLLEQQVAAMRSEAKKQNNDDGTVDVQVDLIKAISQEQIKEVYKEMLETQTTLLQQRKEKQLVDDRVIVMEQQAAEALTVHEQTVQQLMAAEHSTKMAESLKASYEMQMKKLCEEVPVLQKSIALYKTENQALVDEAKAVALGLAESKAKDDGAHREELLELERQVQVLQASSRIEDEMKEEKQAREQLTLMLKAALKQGETKQLNQSQSGHGEKSSKSGTLVASSIFCCMFRLQQYTQLLLSHAVCRFRCNWALDGSRSSNEMRCIHLLEAMLNQMELRQQQLQGQLETVASQLVDKEASIQDLKLQLERAQGNTRVPNKAKPDSPQHELREQLGKMVHKLMHVETRLSRIKVPK